MINIFKSVQKGEYQSAMLTKLKNSSKYGTIGGSVEEADYIKFDVCLPSLLNFFTLFSFLW